MEEYYQKCICCPRMCRINREKEVGYCQNKDQVKVARCALYYDEEPCISGKTGSGTIFFSGCNLRCVYCQNKKISHDNFGKEISIERLVDIMFELKDKKAVNINLVTPTHFIPSIKKSLILAKARHLDLPIVYNTSGYESVQMLKELDGLVDVYLTDFKYGEEELGEKLSHVKHYPKMTKLAIQEMVRQTGIYQFNEEGIMTKGVIVRHLCLPTLKEDSKKIIHYLYETYHDEIYLSIMNQYTKGEETYEFPFLNQSLSCEDYDEIIEDALDIGVRNAYIQEGDTASISYIPDFNLEGV